MSAYPIVIDGGAVAALVVGGGPVAARKVAALLDAGARVHVVALEMGPEVEALAGRAGLRLTRSSYASAAMDGCSLVIAATDDPRVNAGVAADARRRGTLVNVVDAPDLGDFVTPAVHRAGDVVVAVVAGGVPKAAARIRDVIAESVDERYAAAVASLASLRRTLLDRGDRAAWRDASAELIGPAFRDDVESGRLARRADAWR